MNIDERLDRLAEKQQALTESVELLRGSVSDLGAIVHAMVDDTREHRKRDQDYMRILAQVLNSWADGKHDEEAR
jgi:hypothetical protein